MKFQEILLDIPSKYLEVSNCIIERAKKYLDAEIDDNIYISLTDHIHMAVKRYRMDAGSKSIIIGYQTIL